MSHVVRGDDRLCLFRLGGKNHIAVEFSGISGSCSTIPRLCPELRCAQHHDGCKRQVIETGFKKIQSLEAAMRLSPDQLATEVVVIISGIRTTAPEAINRPNQEVTARLGRG